MDRDNTMKLRNETQEKVEKLEALRKKIEELKVLEKSVKKELDLSKSKTERAEERRRDSLVGVMYRNKAKNDPEFSKEMSKDLDKFFTRDYDRILFSLPPLPTTNDKNNAEPESSSPEKSKPSKSKGVVSPDPISPTPNRPIWMPEGTWNGKIYKVKGIYVDGKQIKLTPEQEQELRTLFPQEGE